MKALISKIEPRNTGYRVAQVEPNDNIFDVAEDLFWVDCPGYIEADKYWFDPSDNTFKDYTPPPPSAEQIAISREQLNNALKILQSMTVTNNEQITPPTTQGATNI
jgi:hypothetical protein